MYIKRKISSSFFKTLKSFPAVMISGPRQSGKTTFLKEELKDSTHYVTFDDPLNRQFALEDPNGFLNQFTHFPVILDEIQYAPHLFSYLKIKIDENRNNYGRWLLTGSQQFNLMKNVSDSLAGRIAILQMLPFDFHEKNLYKQFSLEQHIWYGGYPENVLNSDTQTMWLQSYISTYLERDVRQLQNIKDINSFQNFVSLCAATHGQELNIARIARQCGISQPACKEWISILEASFVIIRVKPFYNNFSKRLIKTAKLYFLDSALARFLTKQPDSKSLLAGAMAGAFFEGFVTTETYKILNGKGVIPEIYFWRSREGLEVDLIIRKNNKLYPIEIKLTATPSTNHLKALQSFYKIASQHENIEPGIIVCNVENKKLMPYNIRALNWKDFFEWLDDDK